ncbi:HEAT repeat domain-containing protein [Bradymonas sediminis]|nr:penicillin-insensitive murein endopeptidase [Bradymonas sediminis]TDP72116.1 HEAT repeat protein [Bradymonas sediminis]
METRTPRALMPTRWPVLLAAFAFVGLPFSWAACATTSSIPAVEGGLSAEAKPAPELIPPPQPPPFIGPPPASEEHWTMPDIGTRSPDFPLLPEESSSESRSVGSVTHGWLANARRIPQPHPYLQQLRVQHTRGLNFTSDAMLALVEQAGAHVVKKFPESVVPLGNFSAEGGGDIPYSFSHNSGRDADLGFFVLDSEGQPATPDNLVSLDANGYAEVVGEDGEIQHYYFDAPRNWALVEGLIQADSATLQYIFISNPLKRILLKEARKQGAKRDVVQKASVLLHQPGGALPHDNHFHLRIYCSKTDAESGCVDVGRKVRGYKSHAGARRNIIKKAAKLTGDAEADVRLAAVRRLHMLDASGERDAVIGALADSDARVRAAAARALGEFGVGSDALAKQLVAEEDPQALVEMISALGSIADRDAVDALVAALGVARPIQLPSGMPDAAQVTGAEMTDARIFVAQALVYTESARPVPALIAMLNSEHDGVRQSALSALRILTNYRMVPRAQTPDADGASIRERAVVSPGEVLQRAEAQKVEGEELTPAEIAELWQNWYAEHRAMGRDEWLAGGFRAAGYSVERLSVREVWDLCRAVADDDHLSYNAQRILMRLSKREPASLSWSKEDANFYWRRWFERRWKRLGAPPIPAELSTLK